MNKTFLIFLGLFLFYNSQGQNLVDNGMIGYYFDFNKQLINGYYDFNYEPEKSLKVNYIIGDDFTPGYYYTREGLKVNGLLKYSQYNTFFKFKTKENDKEKTIKPNECDGYVIGVDSFAVIENFDVQRTLGAFHSIDREFAQVIDKIGSLTFYKHTRAGSQNIIDTYIVKADSSKNYISFPKGATRFKEVGAEIFGGFEPLRKGIQTGKYEDEDIPTLIKILMYKKHYDEQSKICFNSSWDEIDNCKDCSYYAKVESLKDSIFHIVYYYSNDIKIYEGDFTSFYPHKKRGNFVIYYPNGGIRKKLNYINNKPQNAIDYFTDGSIHREYKISEEGIVYKQIYDAKGSVLLNETGTCKEIFYDSINNREITYEYINHTLNNVYFIDSNGIKIFQLCDKNAKLKAYKGLQSDIDEWINYPLKSIKDYNHGYVLVKCIVEPTGLTSNFKIIKSVDSACDSAILKFLPLLKINNYWKPAQHKGENVIQEFVIPFDFSINGFSRYRNHYNHFWMQQNMMMQQPTIKLPPPPKMPTYRF